LSVNGNQTGPRSITTTSAISQKKNGKKKINQYILEKLLG
jgi:hypothetical protein